MSTPKLQGALNVIHHEAACKRMVESVSQEVVSVRRVNEDLQEADAMMKSMTQSHADHTSPSGAARKT